jgi:dCMP deaminase
MKEKFIDLYMDWATRLAQLSHAKRLQVGAVIVKDDTVISYGYNGMPAGWDNDCEDKKYDPGAGGWLSPEEFNEQYPYEELHGEFQDHKVRYGLKTKPEVLHAESNAIAKLAKSSNSGLEADIFITHAPCMECAKLIYQSGIKRVFYNKHYRDDAGVAFLQKSGVFVSTPEMREFAKKTRGSKIP